MNATTEKLPRASRKTARPATGADYSTWVDAYRAAGGTTGKPRTGSLPSHFVVAAGDCHVGADYGSAAFHLIVPAGITVTYDPDKLGHNEIFFCADGLYVTDNPFNRKPELFAPGSAHEERIEADRQRELEWMRREGIDPDTGIKTCQLCGKRPGPHTGHVTTVGGNVWEEARCRVCQMMRAVNGLFTALMWTPLVLMLLIALGSGRDTTVFSTVFPYLATTAGAGAAGTLITCRWVGSPESFCLSLFGSAVLALVLIA